MLSSSAPEDTAAAALTTRAAVLQTCVYLAALYEMHFGGPSPESPIPPLLRNIA